MPTEQISTYFQVASSEAEERWQKISGALARVVASMAIHITMMWSETVTMVMVARNSCIEPQKTRSDWISVRLRYPRV